jgi:hypothetical protein
LLPKIPNILQPVEPTVNLMVRRQRLLSTNQNDLGGLSVVVNDNPDNSVRKNRYAGNFSFEQSPTVGYSHYGSAKRKPVSKISEEDKKSHRCMVA